MVPVRMTLYMAFFVKSRIEPGLEPESRENPKPSRENSRLNPAHKSLGIGGAILLLRHTFSTFFWDAYLPLSYRVTDKYKNFGMGFTTSTFCVT